MIPRFYVPGAGDRPPSRQTVYADGSADEHYREGLDLELSHWVPNRTPPQYKADTSTGICLNFVAAPLPGSWDLCINNHLDVDGVLSLYVLVHAEKARAHREQLEGAARMGDFWDWAPLPAQALFQGLLNFQRAYPLGTVPLHEIYERCFTRIHRLLEADPLAVPDARPGIDALARACERAETCRTLLHERFVHYVVEDAPLEQALYVPAFNEPLGEAAWLPPQARNRFDRERLQLVSVKGPGGWYHDLWYPGYRWAETPDSWAAPGFAFAGSSNGYRIEHPGLEAAVQTLRRGGEWRLAEALSPFKSLPGRNYPVILSGHATAQGPAEVGGVLAEAYLPC